MSSRSGYKQLDGLLESNSPRIVKSLCHNRSSPSLLRLPNLIDLNILSGGIVRPAKL
jgi:hypothetical protein